MVDVLLNAWSNAMPGGSAIRCRFNSLCLERALAFLGEAPPRQGRFPRHEAGGSDEGIEQARILDHIGLCAQLLVEDVGILANEVHRNRWFLRWYTRETKSRSVFGATG